MFGNYVSLPSGTGNVYIEKSDLDAYRALGPAGDALLGTRLTMAWEKNAKAWFGSTTIPGPTKAF